MAQLTQALAGAKRGRDNPLRAKTRFWVVWVNSKRVTQIAQVAGGLWVDWVDNKRVTQTTQQPASLPAGQPVSRSAGQPVSRSAGQPVSLPACQPASLPACQPAAPLPRACGCLLRALLLPAPVPTPGGGPTRTGHFYAAPRKNFFYFLQRRKKSLTLGSLRPIRLPLLSRMDVNSRA